MKLVPNWRQSWRYWSTRCGVIGATISGTYASMYPQLKDTIEPSLMATITAVVFVAGIVGRIVSQGIDE